MSNQPHADNTREKKRAQFAGAPGQKSKFTPVLAVIAIATVAIAMYVVFSSSRNQHSATRVATAGSAEGTGADIRIPLSEVSTGKARFFDYKTPDNKALRFFVIRSSDGVYRAALDACDTCFHAKKGYHQEGDDMVCNNCSQRFHSALINEVKGGCNPVGLPRVVEGEEVVVKASDLDSRTGYF